MADEETLTSLCRRGVTVAFDPVPWSLVIKEPRILPFTSNILKQLTEGALQVRCTFLQQSDYTVHRFS